MPSKSTAIDLDDSRRVCFEFDLCIISLLHLAKVDLLIFLSFDHRSHHFMAVGLHYGSIDHHLLLDSEPGEGLL